MSSYDADQIEAIQAVVDRVNSYQESAPENTIDKELRDALTDAGLDVGDEDFTRLSQAIETNQSVSVHDVLG